MAARSGFEDNVRTTAIYHSIQVDPDAYQALLDCVFSSDINVGEKVPSGGGRAGGAKLTNPLGGTGHLVSGADRYGKKPTRALPVAFFWYVRCPVFTNVS